MILVANCLSTASGSIIQSMQVPCCAKIESAVLTAVRNSGKEIPVEVVTISVDGDIV